MNDYGNFSEKSSKMASNLICLSTNEIKVMMSLLFASINFVSHPKPKKDKTVKCSPPPPPSRQDKNPLPRKTFNSDFKLSLLTPQQPLVKMPENEME